MYAFGFPYLKRERFPMRILHVLGTTNLGGAESRIMDLYRNIDREQVQFDFLVHMNGKAYKKAIASGASPETLREQGYFDQEIQALGGHVYALPAFRIYNYFAYKKAVKHFFEKHAGVYDVVHGHMTSTASIYLPVAKKQGVPVTIAHARSAGVDHGMKGILTKWLRKDLWRKADYLLTCSGLAAQAVFGREAIFFPNAINTEAYRFNKEERNRIRKELGIAGDTFVIGHVGRFHYAKNHEYLLHVFAVFHNRVPGSLLLLLGDGPGFQTQQDLAKELGIDRAVIFAGNKENPAPYYNAMDCFVFPSRFEGLPGTAIEAQASGLPSIISDAVAKETEVTDRVVWESIEETPDQWANQVFVFYQSWKNQQTEDSYNDYQIAEARQKYADQVGHAGFDVKVQAGRLQEMYEEFVLTAMNR